MRMMNRTSMLISVLSRSMVLLAVISLLSGPADASAAAAGKTGVVDVSRIIQQMPETKKVENILKSTTSQWGKTLEGMQKDFQTTMADYEKSKASLSASARTQKENELKTKLQAVQNFEQEKFGRDGALAKKQAELMKPIQQKVLTAIKTVAQKEGFSMVLEKQAMIYGDNSLDLTLKVIDQLNK
ncbi:MAG TPA: OmpH family outer membrane protein [Prosthecochloris aestuarii]|uniref:OmpH family outer membrane protein n=1 Tax=Prosthecochloris aestuarii TaxID=1102 RepID=A0A831SPT1_PROAE|nr:OmpH family outer membrane protein [Prosthecochloris aestuarii]